MFDCFDRHLITISSSTYPSVRSFRFQDLLSKSTSLRHVTIDVQEKVLSHQIQFSFGPKLKELVITGSTLINILPDAFLGNRILLSYSALFCSLSLSLVVSLSLLLSFSCNTFFCCFFLLLSPSSLLFLPLCSYINYLRLRSTQGYNPLDSSSESQTRTSAS